jgi:hypothetical protein
VSYWISDDTKATVYASITVLESLGHAIGDPSMQQIFAASLRLPYFWHALPFFVAAVSIGDSESLSMLVNLAEDTLLPGWDIDWLLTARKVYS